MYSGISMGCLGWIREVELVYRAFDCVQCMVLHNSLLLVSSSLDYIERYATEQALRQQEHRESSSESEMSDLSEDEAQDMEL